jgi:hypothetical protein
MLTREEWTRRPGTPTAVQGLILYTGGNETLGGDGRESMGNLCE